jgi:hypothetical protein
MMARTGSTADADGAARERRRDADEGRLDPLAVDAVLAAVGTPSVSPVPVAPAR